MNFVIFTCVLCASELMVLLQALDAYYEGLLSPNQMVCETRITKGLPFFAHGGMWGDFFLISPLIAYIASVYGRQWSASAVIPWLIIGCSASYVLHIVFAQIPWLESHVVSGHLTNAGRIHLVYMGFAIAAFGLVYFETVHVSPLFLLAMGILLPLHLLAGTHMFLGLLKPDWYPGDPLRNIPAWSTICVLTGLIWWRTYYVLTSP